MRAIALSELTQFFRNRLVAATAVLVPLFFAVVLIATRDNFGGSAVVAALVTIVVPAMGMYITATTTLASRRQTLFLKRLRSTAAGDAGIVAGILVPLVVINVVQLAVILAALALIDQMPANFVGLVLCVVTIEALFLGLAVATSGFTNSPDHAQVTSLPVFIITVGVAMWIAFTGTEDLLMVKRLIPGGALTELVIASWNGIEPASMFALLLPTLAWVFVAFVVASQLFRWEPRR